MPRTSVLVAGRWFTPSTPVFPTNKTDCHRGYKIEILLTVALNTITITLTQKQSKDVNRRRSQGQTIMLRLFCLVLTIQVFQIIWLFNLLILSVHDLMKVISEVRRAHKIRSRGT